MRLEPGSSRRRRALWHHGGVLACLPTDCGSHSISSSCWISWGWVRRVMGSTVQRLPAKCNSLMLLTPSAEAPHTDTVVSSLFLIKCVPFQSVRYTGCVMRRVPVLVRGRCVARQPRRKTHVLSRTPSCIPASARPQASSLGDAALASCRDAVLTSEFAVRA